MEDIIKKFIFSMKDKLILFRLLTKNEIEQIIPYFKVIPYPEGSTVFNEGDSGDFIGIILSGILEVKKHTEFKGRQIIIATLKKGSLVGEMSLINKKEPRSAAVVACKDSELLIITRDTLEYILQKYPHIGIKILKNLNQILAIRLRKNVERLAGIF
jgi:CRP-like cAMP-binding protein